MASNRAEIFDEKRPRVEEIDLITAAKENRVVVSWSALPSINEDERIIALAIKFALGDGSFPTVLFDRHAALVLRLLLDRLEQSDWRATQKAPPGQKPH